MTPVSIETIVLPKIKRLEGLQLEAHRLTHEPMHTVHAEVQQTLTELMEILKDIPAFRYPLSYRVKFPRTH